MKRKLHKIGCNCLPCKNKRGEVHKLDCKCASCKSKRGEYTKENHPNWIGNKAKSRQTYYCIDSCGKVVSKEGNRCRSCTNKILYNLGILNNRDKNNGRYKDGKRSYDRHKIYYCIEPNCKNIVSGPNKRCHSCSHKGSKCWRWKGGITSLVNMIKNTNEYKNWRKGVFERDKYTCQKCRQYGEEIHPHHIKSFKEIFNKFLQVYFQFSPIEDKEVLLRLALTYLPFWDVNNGETLCKNCHKLTDSYGKSKSCETTRNRTFKVC